MSVPENTAPSNTPVDTVLSAKLREHLAKANTKPHPGQLLIKYEWSGDQIVGRIPGSGKGTSDLQGFGEFTSRQPAAFLSGRYLLEIGRTEARLYDGDEQIWFGKGKQEGLKGRTYIEFKELDPA